MYKPYAGIVATPGTRQNEHPQSDGMVERYIKNNRGTPAKILPVAIERWDARLPILLLAIGHPPTTQQA
jgi:hypothetical protein